MTDMDEHRRNRLRALLAGPPYHGDRQAFLRASGLSKGRLTQLLEEGGTFGERAGIALAQRLELPEDRYFDLGIDRDPEVDRQLRNALVHGQAPLTIESALAFLHHTLRERQGIARAQTVNAIRYFLDHPDEWKQAAEQIEAAAVVSPPAEAPGPTPAAPVPAPFVPPPKKLPRARVHPVKGAARGQAKRKGQ